MNNHRFLFLAVAPLLLAACAQQKPKATPSPAAPVASTSQKTMTASATPAQAAPAAEVPTSPAGPYVKAYGVVVSYDADTRKLSIKDKRGVTRTFVVASDAKLTKGGDDTAISVDDLKAGQHVSLKTGGEIAASVHVKVTAADGSASSVAKH